LLTLLYGPSQTIYKIEYIDLVQIDPDQQNNQSNALSFDFIFGLVALGSISRIHIESTLKNYRT